ncbi:MAG: undecaprenyl-diphosphatase [Sphingomonadales bacterium]|jgi:undecaprenyl-diphosphatase|nr:undecaprenyl-diphosphatase [Sphingomonadales bacterium]
MMKLAQHAGAVWKRLRRVESSVLLAFMAVAVFGLVFLRVASEMAEGDTMSADRFVIRALRDPADPALSLGPQWLRSAMIDFTALGGPPVLTLLTVFAVGYLLAVRRAATAVFVAVSVTGGAVLGILLKSLFVRPRPEIVPHLVDVQSASFPSGHALNSAIVYLTLGALLARTQSSRRVKAYLLGAAILLTLIVGSSRVYLGVHWPSDVVAGWCVGAAWAALCALLARYLQRRRTLEQPTTDEPDPDTTKQTITQTD